MSDENPSVNHPTHYQGASEIGKPLLKRHFGLSDDILSGECINFLESSKQYCKFHLGNAIKYLWRCGVKGSAKDDLLKALWYLDRWESLEEPWLLRLWDTLTRSPNLKTRLAVRGLIAEIENILQSAQDPIDHG